MVSPVDPSQTIARLSALIGQASARRAQTPGLVPGQSGMSPACTPVRPAWREQLRAIGPEHPRRKRAMARVLIETFLVNEFGVAAGNDAAFQLVVDDVLDAMERSPTLASDIDRVVDVLLSAAD